MVEEADPAAVLRQFWELESLGITDAMTESPTKSDIMQGFETTITKSNERYEVGLPWKSSVELAANEDVAKRTLENLRKKLARNPDLL